MVKKPARPDPGPERAAPETAGAEAAEPRSLRKLTHMRCPNCGVLMTGVADRYACTACETYASYEP